LRSLKGRDYSKGLGIDEDNIKMDLGEKGWEGVD
jgi:hypothetical protein